MGTRELHNRLRRLEVAHGGQLMPCCLLVPDPGELGRDAVLAQVARLRSQGRMVITLSRTADKHLAVDELLETFPI